MASIKQFIQRLTASTALLLGALSVAGAAGAVEYSTYLPNATAPTGGVWVLDGTGLAGGHLWVFDHLQGFCRLNPAPSSGTGPARLFWADDPSAGANVLLGHWYAAPMSDLGLP